MIKKKILIVETKINPYREPLYKLINEKYDCFWIFTQEKKSNLRNYKWLGDNVFVPKQMKMGKLVPITFILFKLFKIDYDYILSAPSIYPECWQSFIVSKLRNKKIILWDEEFEWQRNFKRRLILPFTSFINRNSDFILASSIKHKEWQLKQGVSKYKLVLFPNVTNITKKDVDRVKCSELIKKYNLKNKKIIMFVGRLIKLKGVEYLIKAYAQLIKSDKYLKNTVLIIVGDGEYRNKLEKLVYDLNLEKKVIFTGYVNNNDLVNYYNISDIGVVPSFCYNGIAEAWGLVVNEFLELGKKVVCSDVVGAGYYFFKKDDLVDVKNLKDFTNKIIYYLENKQSLKNDKVLNNNYKYCLDLIGGVLKK